MQQRSLVATGNRAFSRVQHRPDVRAPLEHNLLSGASAIAQVTMRCDGKPAQRAHDKIAPRLRETSTPHTCGHRSAWSQSTIGRDALQLTDVGRGILQRRLPLQIAELSQELVGFFKRGNEHLVARTAVVEESVPLAVVAK